MCACEDLPQELIVAIVDNIRDDKKSLKAFSLVCKAWTNPARDHLFASLTISKQDHRLEQIKAANIASTFTPFLRHLRLTAYGDHHKFWEEVIPFLADFRTPRLRSLVLTFLTWHSLSPNQQLAFFRLFESIVSLQLTLYEQTPTDVATIICSLPHLRKLILRPSLLQLGALPAPFPLSPALRLPERLSTLRVWYLYQDYRLFLEWLSSIPEQLSIRIFHLILYHLSPQDMDTVNMFLKALGPSLEVFFCNSNSTFIHSARTVEPF
jgi:hypothetical protein